MNWRRSVLLKKLRRYASAPLRHAVTALESDENRMDCPPVIANSVPKSGTHLLIQILQVVPDSRDWGLFLASTPSMRMQEISAHTLCRKIRGLAAGELIGAHMHHDPAIEDALRDARAVSYFIYRDPRDVAVSEALYLSEMNRWHRLHGAFSRLPDVASQVMLAIEGLGSEESIDYPDIAARYRKYLGWITSGATHAVKYENLLGDERENAVRGILDHYCSCSRRPLDLGGLTELALHRIRPEQSHTFRKGTTGEWREHFSAQHVARFKEISGDLLITLGYEKDYDW